MCTYTPPPAYTYTLIHRRSNDLLEINSNVRSESLSVSFDSPDCCQSFHPPAPPCISGFKRESIYLLIRCTGSVTRLLAELRWSSTHQRNCCTDSRCHSNVTDPIGDPSSEVAVSKPVGSRGGLGSGTMSKCMLWSRHHYAKGHIAKAFSGGRVWVLRLWRKCPP